MPAGTKGSVSLDLTKEVKEMQLQHGLRNDDYARYHKYLTRRLHTLRCQLNLSNAKNKYMKKKVTPNNASQPGHVQMLIVEAERAWATAEEVRAKIVDVSAQREESGGPTISSMHHHERSRMNKAQSWGVKLVEVCEAVGDERLIAESQAYAAELAGRNALSHQAYDLSKQHFKEARELYYSLRKLTTDQEQWTLLVSKIRECDDRVVYSMQRLGEAANKYNPPLETRLAGGKGGSKDSAQSQQDEYESGSKIRWLGRDLDVTSVKVKEIIRDIVAVTKEKADFEKSKDCVASLSAQPKLLEYYDRLIGLYNDAISHTQQDIRDNTGGDRTNLQLSEHSLRYNVHLQTLKRTQFLIEVYIRRYLLTQAAQNKSAGLPLLLAPTMSVLTSSNGTIDASSFDPQYAASPLEIVHLYDTAIESVNKMLILPGVEDDDRVGVETNDELALCKAGRMLFHGEGWLIADNNPVALGAFQHVEKILREVSGAVAKEKAQALLTAARVATTRVAVAPHLKSSESSSSSASLNETSGKDFVRAKSLVRLPPDYQSVPCKPIFVDIASTFVDMPSLNPAPKKQQQASAPAKHVDPQSSGGGAAKKPAAAPKKETPAVPQHVQEEQEEAGNGGDAGQKKGWFSGWGWGGKK